jgi:hypothetical protein
MTRHSSYFDGVKVRNEGYIDLAEIIPQLTRPITGKHSSRSSHFSIDEDLSLDGWDLAIL